MWMWLYVSRNRWINVANTRSLLLLMILSNFHHSPIYTAYFPKIHLNVIITSRSLFYKSSSSMWFKHQNCVCIFFSSVLLFNIHYFPLLSSYFHTSSVTICFHTIVIYILSSKNKPRLRPILKNLQCDCPEVWLYVWKLCTYIFVHKIWQKTYITDVVHKGNLIVWYRNWWNWTWVRPRIGFLLADARTCTA
jgi:hypothetical protein